MQGRAPCSALERPVLTAHVGGNDRLIADVARLYLPRNALVWDMTYGRGVFWRRVHGGFRLVRADIRPLNGMAAGSGGVMLAGLPRTHFSVLADFRRTPCAAGAVDVVVLDPPYMRGGRDVRHENLRRQYGLGSVRWAVRKGVLDAYSAGMREAARILRPGGFLWVKCMDEVDNHVQCWTHVSVLETARGIGFEPEDLFVLVQDHVPAMRHERQVHARKNHSYLWIFRARWPAGTWEDQA